MDQIEKALKKLSGDDRKRIKKIMQLLKEGKTDNLDIKKLKGRDDIFRVRSGNNRVLYRFDNNGEYQILTIERRNEHTYKF